MINAVIFAFGLVTGIGCLCICIAMLGAHEVGGAVLAGGAAAICLGSADRAARDTFKC